MARGDFSSLRGPWRFSGELVGGGTFDAKLTRQGSLDGTCRWATRDWKSPTIWATVLNPPGSGGLLAALHLWRKLQVGGPGHFGEVIYMGTMPLEGHDGLVDVVRGTTGGVDCQFMFDPADGTLLALEMYPQADADPCEVYFSDYRETEAVSCPTASKSATATTCSTCSTSRSTICRKAARNESAHELSRRRNFHERCRGWVHAASCAIGGIGSAGLRSPAWRSLAAVFLAAVLLAARPAAAGPSLSHVIAQVQPKIVKIFGSGGLRGLADVSKRISDLGRRLRADRLEPRARHRRSDRDSRRRPKVHRQAGRRRSAIGIGGAEDRSHRTLPFFDLSAPVPAAEGTRVLAFSNLFGVATGDEPASVLHGTIAAVTTLDARRGAYETPYQGPIYALDAMTNNPGAAGGALTDLHGRLLGVLGKELRNARNNIWLNFAIPTAEFASSIEAIRRARRRRAPKEQAQEARQSADAGPLGHRAGSERVGPHAAVCRRCAARFGRRRPASIPTT